LTGQTPVTFAVEGTPGPGRVIAPLLLLPFVENAFKFGASTREWAPIDIRIVHFPDRLEFQCRNKIIRRNVLSTEISGIGIANTRRRLELIYPGKHRLVTSEQAGFFEVFLTIYRTD
jgi:sensor histidine kinase YesM